MKKLLITLLSVSTVLFTFAQYQVGHTTITFNDPARSGGFGSGGGPGRQIQTEIYYPAATAGDDVAMIAEEFPVVVFGHGFAMAWDAYENIWEEMVPKGYIFAFPRTEGGLLPAPSHEDFGLDLSVVLDRMLLENDESASIFFEGINGKAAIMGHSMGGGATFIAGAENENVVTVIGLGPAETDPSAIAAAANITVPGLILSGDEDGVTPDDENHIPIYDALDSDCKYFVSILGGGHCYYANSNFNCDFGESTSGGATIDRAEQQQITYDAITPWLDYYLKGICEAKDDFIDFADNDTRVSSNSDCNYTPLAEPTITENANVLTSSVAPSYQWTKDGEIVDGETNQTFTMTGDGTYTVIVSDGYCELESDEFVLGGGGNDTEPTASFSADQQVVCEGTQIQYTDLSEGGNITDWNWTFEGGTPATSTDQNPVVTYSDAGSYSVTLEVENSMGVDESTETTYITVNGSPAVPQVNQNGNWLYVTTSANETAEWFFGGTSVQIGDSLSAQTSGTYTVVITNSNNCSSEADYVFSTSNVFEWMNDVSVYPNPVTHVLNFENRTGSELSYNIFDAQGRIVLNGNTKGEMTEINFGTLTNGVYTLQINNGGVVSSKKIIKQ